MSEENMAMKVGESRIVRLCDYGIKIVPSDVQFIKCCKSMDYCETAARAVFSDGDIVFWDAVATDPLDGFSYGGRKKGILCTGKNGERYYMEAHRDRSLTSLARAMACADALRKRLVDQYGDNAPLLHVGLITEEDEFGKGNMHTILSRVDSQGLPFDDGYTIHYFWLGKYMTYDYKVTLKSVEEPTAKEAIS